MLNSLYEKNVITSKEMEELRQDRTLTMSAANSLLLDLMAEKSMPIFRKFLDTLKETLQHDIYSTINPTNSGLLMSEFRIKTNALQQCTS